MAKRTKEEACDVLPIPGAAREVRAIENVLLELPIGEYREHAARPTHIEARLSPKQGRALQRLLNGLNAKYGQGWRLRDFGMADVLRWLLDQLPD